MLINASIVFDTKQESELRFAPEHVFMNSNIGFNPTPSCPSPLGRRLGSHEFAAAVEMTTTPKILAWVIQRVNIGICSSYDQT
jgi:hypothetical protein